MSVNTFLLKTIELFGKRQANIAAHTLAKGAICHAWLKVFTTTPT